MVKSRSQHSVHNILAGLINKILLMFLQFFLRTIIVFTIGVDYLGLNGLFTSLLQVLNLAELGFGSALGFSMYKPILENDKEKINALLSLYRKVYTTIGLALLAIGLLILPFLPVIIKDDVPNNINIYLLFIIYLINTVLSYLVFAYKKSLIEAYQRYDITTNINTFISIVKYIIQIIILLLLKNYYLYLIVMPIFTFVENYIVAKQADLLFPTLRPEGNLNKEEINDIKLHVKGLAIQKLCSSSRNSFDSIVISMYLGLSSIAIYNNYLLILTAVHGILYQIANSIRASVGNSIATGNLDKNFKLFMNMNFFYMWISIVCTACLMGLYQPFMELWMGEKMLCSTHTVILFCIYFFELCFSDIISVFKDGAGIWWHGRYRTVIEAFSNLILNFILGYYMGMDGILLATIITIGLIGHLYGGYITFNYYFKNVKHKRYLFYQIQTSIIAAFVTYSTYMACSVVLKSGIVGLLIKGVICVCLPNILLVMIYCKTDLFQNSLDFLKNVVMQMIK